MAGPEAQSNRSAARNSAGEELWALLAHSPDAYLQKIDVVRGLALIIRLTREAYRAASFLDDRILEPGTAGAWIQGGRANEAARRVTDPRPVHFIFHSGHVGSTLVSRLLDETGGVLSLREPLPLRSLADACDVLAQPESLLSESQFDALLETTLRLWSRGYPDTRAVVVKATSTAGRLAVRLLQARPSSSAIYLNLPAEPYIATLLAGANSADDLRGHGPGRIRRLAGRCTARLPALHQLSLGELAALGWLAETASQLDARQRLPDRVLTVNFEALLSDVGGVMRAIGRHLGLPAEDHVFSAMASSPVLARYSKSPDRPYSASDRAVLLRDSRSRNREEIARGMDWLERLAREDDSLARLVNERIA